MAYQLQTNLVKQVQLLMPDSNSMAVQISGVIPFPVGGATGGTVIPLDTNLVQWVQLCFPDANGNIVQVSAANPLPIQ